LRDFGWQAEPIAATANSANNKRKSGNPPGPESLIWRAGIFPETCALFRVIQNR
jgi:hypothetical protein